MKLYYIDLFSGAGGVTQGIETTVLRSKKVAKVVACVNHNAAAIASHKLNHPNCAHFVEDVRTLDITKLLKITDRIRKKDKSAVIILWASLECTHFSPARGAAPMLDDSRTLAYSLYKYISILKPDYIHIENVKAFLDWGPLGDNCLPIKDKKGIDYKQWRDTVMNVYGYKNYEHKVFNSADFGVPQTRSRIFLQFSKELPLAWPKETHTKINYTPVSTVLDLTNKGEDIFSRKKPLVEKTLSRIHRGLLKHSQDASFLTKYYSTGSNTISTSLPSPTLTKKDRLLLINVDHFVRRDDRTGIYTPITKPISALTTVPKHHLVELQYLWDDQYGNLGRTVDKPAQTIISRQDKKPLKLLTASKETGNVTILPTDNTITVQIKQFMIANSITKISSRLLTVQELLGVMGMPKDYKFAASSTLAKEFIGNAVTPEIPRLWALSIYDTLSKHFN